MSINSESVTKLCDALIDNGHPTPDEIRRAMAIAYEAGKIDGSLEQLNKWLSVAEVKA